MSADGTNADEDKEEVRQLLREAFPPVSARKDLRPLSHEEAVKMRTCLFSLRNEDHPFYLRQVLEDLLDTHTDKAVESQDADAVVQHLNVLVESTDIDALRNYLSSAAIQQALIEENYLRSMLAETYASYTRPQALAISKWLGLAKRWKDLDWYQEDIEAALRYWRRRAADSGGGEHKRGQAT